MKLCQSCSQPLAEQIKNCPNCGSDVSEGPQCIDDYRILRVVHEGHATILCQGIRDGDDTPIAIRLFTADSGVDDRVAQRLKDELEELQKLPQEWFVRHHAIKRSATGLWYRVSEWVDGESWGDLLSSDRLENIEITYDLFYRLAAILSGLHKSDHFIPHLILNDILVLKGEAGPVDVKIDYKLSRFLDPTMAQPGPMLQNLLICHPDITKGRPLNFKSDIWSLGRIFVQILSADYDISDPLPSTKSDDFPEAIGPLIRAMLADDPDLRPRSMEEVANALTRLKEEAEKGPQPAPETTGEIRKLKKTVVVFSLLIVILAAAGGGFLFRFLHRMPDKEKVLEQYANLYAQSTAFVVVEYTLQVEDTVVYRQRTEGTAFLVDNAGYLLTNRHVACPWLEDDRFSVIVEKIRGVGKIPRFDYRIYLWFEGETAFNRLIGLPASENLADTYNLSSAHSRGGEESLIIAGVAKAPVRTDQLINAPLGDDFAVLKINHVPQKLEPLHLDKDLEVTLLKRLSPVITLGFPLGSRTQADTINVSVTQGHIRRTFENFFQVDTSIYRGNSGGPIIDERGMVIGIASAVATDTARAPMPVITNLSDIGLVLPVTKAAAFISDLKSGKAKWNGVPDLLVHTKIKKITDAAAAGRWAEARQQANKNLEDSSEPLLLSAAAMTYFCMEDFKGAARLFDRVLSIDEENDQARLMRYLVDRHNGGGLQSPHLRHLLSLDWRSPGEFPGFLGKILAGSIEPDTALNGWSNLNEKGWISYIVGLLYLEENRGEEAQRFFEDAARFSDRNEWSFYLALAQLDTMAARRVLGETAMAAFREELKNIADKKVKQVEEISSLAARFEASAADPGARRQYLAGILALRPDNRRLMAMLAYYDAMISDWPTALQSANSYLQLGGREDALNLSTHILVPGILQHQGKEEEARSRLRDFCQKTTTTWYLQLCQTLLQERSEEDLMEKGGKVPENILTAHTALGFWAEAKGERELALHHYREALGSYLDTWIEYDLARQRYLKLSQEKDKK